MKMKTQHIKIYGKSVKLCWKGKLKPIEMQRSVKLVIYPTKEKKKKRNENKIAKSKMKVNKKIRAEINENEK